MAIDNSNLPRYGPDLSALGLRSISSLAEKAGIRQDGNGTKISESNLWVARGKNTQNREWDSEGGREGSPIQEQANTVEAGGTGADLQVTRRFQQQMEIEEMNRKKDTQYLGNSAGQNVGKETKKDKRIVGITLEEGEGEKVIYEKGTGSALKGHFHNLKLKEKGVEPMQVTHKQNKVREIKEMENAEREASESKKPSNSPEERKYWASSTSKPIGINFITEIGLTKGEQNISTMIGIRRKEVEFFKRAMEGDKQDKKEKNELGKRVQGENDLDQRHLWWNYREQAKTVSNYLQAGQQIYSSDDGDLYIVELANEEDEKDEVAKQTESIAETWETELASHINKSLKLKRRRDDEIPMMIEGAENEEEDAESAGLHLRGRKKKGNRWIGNFVYGCPNYKQRRKQWRNITATTTNVGEAQLYIGDFNDVLSQEEKIGMHPKPQAHVREFRNFVDANFLIDLDLKGSRFTWFSNPRNGFVTRERIDRAMANWEWWSLNQHASLSALPAVSSDHCPLVLKLEQNIRIQKAFKFEAYWTDHKECKEIVKKGWNRGGETDSEGAGSLFPVELPLFACICYLCSDLRHCLCEFYLCCPLLCISSHLHYPQLHRAITVYKFDYFSYSPISTLVCAVMKSMTLCRRREIHDSLSSSFRVAAAPSPPLSAASLSSICCC
ncbi:hypothetical protein Ahy_B08g093351 [Arachis hypogaea]|uniref:Endonuclease/exonuclease/phosphatase domain-containing protein n=1 Tax=Arachis hypogaea TaxID=3818 RepID=A0A444Y618_ARAHY|nr:hypothetical protein Ahy_B08g093351 [Arachis hypogaea]